MICALIHKHELHGVSIQNMYFCIRTVKYDVAYAKLHVLRKYVFLHMQKYILFVKYVVLHMQNIMFCISMYFCTNSIVRQLLPSSYSHMVELTPRHHPSLTVC